MGIFEIIFKISKEFFVILGLVEYEKKMNFYVKLFFLAHMYSKSTNRTKSAVLLQYCSTSIIYHPVFWKAVTVPLLADDF